MTLIFTKTILKVTLRSFITYYLFTFHIYNNFMFEINVANLKSILIPL